MKDKHLQSAMTHARVFTTEIQRPQKRSHNISRPSPMKYQTAHQLYCQSITLWLIFMHLAAFTHNNSSRTASLLSFLYCRVYEISHISHRTREPSDSNSAYSAVVTI